MTIANGTYSLIAHGFDYETDSLETLFGTYMHDEDGFDMRYALTYRYALLLKEWNAARYESIGSECGVHFVGKSEADSIAWQGETLSDEDEGTILVECATCDDDSMNYVELGQRRCAECDDVAYRLAVLARSIRYVGHHGPDCGCGSYLHLR